MSKEIHVTIFGAGVAGLSAAHELAERGFDVTVVEKREDPFCPGECQVGGMARTQWARIPGHEFRTGLATWRAVRTRKPLAFTKAFETKETPNKLLYCEPAAVDATYVLDDHQLLLREKPELRFEENCDELVSPATERLEAMVKHLKTYVHDNLYYDGHGKPVADATGRVPSDVVEHLYVEGYRAVEECRDIGRMRAEKVRDEVRRQLKQPIEGKHTHLEYADFIHVSARDVGAAFQDDWTLETHQQRVVRLRLREIIVPGEHGYRFFPAFYRHIFDIMKRIPILQERRKTLEEFSRAVATEDHIRRLNAQPPGERDTRPTEREVVGRYSSDIARGISRFKLVETGTTAYDNLSSVTYHSIAQAERPELPAILPRTQPMSLSEAMAAFRATQEDLGFELLDMARYQLRILQYVTMCSERRRELAERAWTDFIGIETYSEQFQKVMDVWPQALIGMRAYEADAQTCGNISVQMLLDQVRSAGFRDGTLNAPTSVAWLDPWRQYLKDQGVQFIRAKLDGIGWEENDGYPTFRVDTFAPTKAQDGYVILALPVEEAQRLVDAFATRYQDNDAVKKEFEGSDLDTLRNFVKWDEAMMKDPHPDGSLQHFSGVQYYLEQDHNLVRGHTYFANSPWGVTSISQAQFRVDRPDWRQEYRGILSVDIGSCYDKGLDDSASVWERSPNSVAHEIWRQMNDAIGVENEKLPDPLWYHIDDDLKFKEGATGVSSNETPYLLSRPKEFARRPGRESTVKVKVHGEGDRDAVTEKKGLAYDVTFRKSKDFRGVVLAGSYMKTFTRLATMEAANESARHAVNAILHDCEDRRKKGFLKGRTGQPCQTWNVEEEEFPDLAWLKDLDQRLLARGLPHFIEILDLDSTLRSTNLADPLQQVRKLSDMLADAKEFPWSLLKLGTPQEVLRALASALSGSSESSS